MTEKGTVFLDGTNRPYLRRKWGDEGNEWLFYWHVEGHWTSLRKIESYDRFPENLSQSDQNIYHEQHEKWEKDLEADPPVI